MNPLLHYDPDDPYPESDGQPMADNTEQYEWLVKIKENLEILFADRTDVFIAGDLLWYPVPDRRITGPIAPDVMVVLGRPKGRRGSYKQWEEEDIAPQVVFEILSPSNSRKEMLDKWNFYAAYGVEEYYVYDPQSNWLEIWLRRNNHLESIPHVKGWTSPRLGIRFEFQPDTLLISYPDGRPFLTSIELDKRALEERLRAERAEKRASEERQRAKQADQRAEKARQRAEQADQQVEKERQRAAKLAERLRALGHNPNEV